MLFKNLCFVVGVLLLLVSPIRAGDNTTEKLTRRCKDNERRALLEFKAGVTDDYGMLSSWGNNSNEEECCNWRGIRCSNRTGHVTLLNLARYFSYDAYTSVTLMGKISPSLGELKHLKYLNLSRNRFDGEIPPQLGNLTNLRFLDLSANEFDGEIPPQLGNLTNLRSLDLGYSGYYAVGNLDWVSHLHLLTHLDLSWVNLNSCTGWLNQIYKLSSLTHLHLRQCYLPDQFGPPLPLINTSFSALNSLAVVDLSDNFFISAKSYNWLFNFTTTLVYLDLSYNHFPRSEIPEAFGRIISLESLILPVCGLEGMLPDSFRNLSRLATLDLHWNNFNGSLSEFLNPLATNEKNSIQVLNLRDNHLHGSLPDYFKRFTSLQKLLISYNKLSGSFPDNFWQPSSTLVHLDLSYNQLTGPVPDNYWQLPYSLVHLDLSYNQITGPFSDNFSQLPSSLVHLDLSYNQITGPLPNLTLLSSLERLILINNKLEGIVPETYLSNLSKLTILDLSSNSLSFNFSFDWLPPFQLDILLLKNCTLGPHFPNWITSQSNISVLDISHARISDKIPLQFWDLLPRLSTLNMSNNQIQGILPNISLPDIPWIDLSNNRLQGLIPSLPLSLYFLDLSHNMFTGSLSLICTSPYKQLFYLDLSHNKLSGDLVANCLMNSHLLTTLYLGNNDFSGNIPTSIGLLNQLDILQLRNNNFTGQLPLSMMNFTYLNLLDLSENKLSGKVPSWIGTRLKSLVVLSLRNNEFSGTIPPQICHMRNAQVLDLGQNNLTGSIPHCINNFTSLVEKETNNNVVVYGDPYGPRRGYPDTRLPTVGVQWKGVPSEYERTLKYLKLIDLSSNRLVGEIPKEFASLEGLISLNLSFNSLTGNIIPKIGQMENLESLDLSRNNLSGEIPSGLANLTLLSILDLSNNNLKGEIPKSTQLQSFDPTKYAGNEYLCGLPLPNKCGGERSLLTGHDDKDETNEEDDKVPKFWLYASVAFGFGTGFWGFIGPIMLRRTWRHSYYKWLGNTADWICVTLILHLTRLRRKFYG